MRAFYVYELIDPRDHAVFYVGKGKGNRWKHHRREAVSGKFSRKCDLIREIEESGASYDVRFVSEHLTETAAYEAEKLHIEQIGLDALTNVVPGGTGGYEIWREKKKPTPEQIVKNCAKDIRKIMLFSDLGMTVKIHGQSVDLLAIGRAVCDKLREQVGVDAFNRAVRPYIVSNGGTECLS